MIMNIVHFLHLLQKFVLQLRLDNGSDLKEEVQLANKIFSKGKVTSRHIPFDNIVESKVSRVAKKLLIIQFWNIKIEFWANGGSILDIESSFITFTIHILYDL